MRILQFWFFSVLTISFFFICLIVGLLVLFDWTIQNSLIAIISLTVGLLLPVCIVERWLVVGSLSPFPVSGSSIRLVLFLLSAVLANFQRQRRQIRNGTIHKDTVPNRNVACYLSNLSLFYSKFFPSSNVGAIGGLVETQNTDSDPTLRCSHQKCSRWHRGVRDELGFIFSSVDCCPMWTLICCCCWKKPYAQCASSTLDYQSNLT